MPADGGARAASALKNISFNAIRARLMALYYDMEHQTIGRRPSAVWSPNKEAGNDGDEGQYSAEPASGREPAEPAPRRRGRSRKGAEPQVKEVPPEAVQKRRGRSKKAAEA